MEQEIRLLNHKVKKAFLIRLLVHLADSDTGNRRVDCVLETLFPKSALHPFLQEGKICTVWRVRQGMVEAPRATPSPQLQSDISICSVLFCIL